MNSFIDEIKDSIEQSGLIEKLTPAHISAVMAAALVCGIVIYIVYRAFFRGAVYSESFNVLNVMTCLVTAFIIMTISSNLVLSLGMVGALSIVRFRAAIKDPLDIGFLFLAIAAGLTAGAGLLPLALIGTFTICAVYIIFTLIGSGRRSFVMVVKFSDSAKEKVMDTVKKYGGKMKSCIAGKDFTELTVSLKLKGNDISAVEEIKKLEGVSSAVLMEYVGD